MTGVAIRCPGNAVGAPTKRFARRRSLLARLKKEAEAGMRKRDIIRFGRVSKAADASK